MLKRFTKIIFCCFSAIVIIVSMCPISVYAAPDLYWPIASDKPTVTDYSGYVELLFEHKTSGYRFVTVVSWFFTPSVNTSSEFYVTSDKPVLTIVRNESQFRLGISTQEGVTGNMSFLSFDTGSQLNFGLIEIPDNDATYYYPVSYGNDYNLIGMHYYGDFASVNTSNALSNTEFYVTYGGTSVISHGLNQIISALYSLIDVVGQDSYSSQLDDIIEKLNSIDTTQSDWFTQYKSDVELLFDFIGDILGKLESIVTNTDELEFKLEELYNLTSMLYTSVINIEYYLPWIEAAIYDVSEKLNAIFNLLNNKGSFSESITIYDNPVFDDLDNAQNELYSQYDIDLNTIADFELNNQAMDVVWSITDTFINSHPKIMPIIIAVLVLGVIALVLGR